MTMRAARPIRTRAPAAARRRRASLWPALILLTAPAGAAAAAPQAGALPEAPARPGVTHALLLNGGSTPASNYLSHLHHLQDMVRALERRGVPPERIHIFTADGDDPEPDLAARDTQPPGFWLIAGTSTGRRLQPRTELIDTRWPDRLLRPARKAALREWFEAAPERFAAGDRLLLFVTDHGAGNTGDPDNGSISLWKEDLQVRELKELLALLPDGVVTVMVMSQCYSGTFANAALQAGSPPPSGAVCGFFSTTRDLPSYGCYPEGRDRDRIGHAFHFIDALDRHAAAGGAHLEVLVADRTPDVPQRTSDVYLEQIVAREAARRGTTLDALADRALDRAWRDHAAREAEAGLLERLGRAYGLPVPRTLAAIASHDSDLPALIERARNVGERWRAALVSVREENLEDFLRGRPEWRSRLEEGAIEGLDAAARLRLLLDLLPDLERHARDRHEIWTRLEDLRERARRASGARWRLEVRRAALLRMRSVLIGIAGRVLLAPEPAAFAGPPSRDGAPEEGGADRRAPRRRVQERPDFERPVAGGSADERAALARLEECEAFEPGAPADGAPAGAVAPAPPDRPYPPLEEERRRLEALVPSWLGVRFGPVPEAVRAGRDLPAGAARLLEIVPDSPAAAGGLLAGDVVLGPPGRPFAFPGRLREWTMTAPGDTPLPLVVLRPGTRPDDDLELVTTLSLRPLPPD
jgi:hypothetical protein